MQSVSNDNFGPLIAYLLPGATVLVGLSPFSATLQSWLTTVPADAPTIGGFLYLTVASLAAGMTVSTVRWVIVDTVHAWTGLPPPVLDFSRLGNNVDAYGMLIEIHYRHYQFHANMLVAVAFAYVCLRINGGIPYGWPDGAVLLVEGAFFLTSRDNLRKYYARTQQLLGVRRR